MRFSQSVIRNSVLVLLGLGMSGGTRSYASLTTITASPYPPVFGRPITYTAVRSNDDPEVDHFKWEYQCLTCGPATWFVGSSTDISATFWETRIGSYNIKVTAYYKTVPNPNLHPNPPDPTSVTRSVTIDKPDGFRIIAGNRTPTTPGPTTPVVMKFQLTQGDEDCGPYFSGLAQEREPNPDPEVGWVPAPAATPEFFLQWGVIIDNHTFQIDPGQWAGIPIQTVFLSPHVIELRVIVLNCCGEQVKCPLGSWTFQRRKVSATEWQNEVQ